MAIGDHDRDMRSDLRYDGSNTSTMALFAAAVIIGLILLFMMVPRTDGPTTSTTNPTKAPVITTVPRDTAPVTPSTTPKQP